MQYRIPIEFKVIVVGADEPVARVTPAVVNAEHATAAVVDDTGALVGALDAASIQRAVRGNWKGRVEHFMHRVPAIPDDQPFLITEDILPKCHDEFWYVVDAAQRPLGKVRRSTLLRRLAEGSLKEFTKESGAATREPAPIVHSGASDAKMRFVWTMLATCVALVKRWLERLV